MAHIQNLGLQSVVGAVCFGYSNWLVRQIARFERITSCIEQRSAKASAASQLFLCVLLGK